MATKLDTEKPLFLGNEKTREVTVFGNIRKAVWELDKGDGVSYDDLEAHLLTNFKPNKSKTYDASYVKSYVRDAVNKFGYLSHEDIGASYEIVTTAEKTPAQAKVKAPTKAQVAQNEVLAFIRDRGDVVDVNDVDDTQFTAEMIMQELKKKQKTVDTMVAALVKATYLRTEEVDGTTYVYLTPEGLEHVNAVSPAAEDSSDDEA